jgi:Fur family transcriptional regulator, stress-responsive regulator
VDAPGATRLTDGDLDDRAAGALRAAGLRMTRPRLAVHRALARLGGHRTADEVVSALNRGGGHLARTSVYNALDALRAAGLVMQASTGAGRALYEVATTWHHHFVCRACGQVTDVPCAVAAKPCLDPQLPGAEIEEAAVVYRGVCARCAAKKPLA